MAKSDDSFIRWFAELRMADVPSVGGKGASLGELTHAEIPVPPGFVITTTAFERFLAHADPKDNIRTEIGALAMDDTAAIASCGARIRQAVCEADMPAGIADAISDNYRRLSQNGGACPVAVRSSATAEDSEDASFAGLQDTYLWINDEAELLDRVRSCWASLYNDESISYRRRLDLPEDQLSIAVVVQRMVDAECAGVMFTRSPTTGDKSVIIIEGSWGLGSCIVNGEVTPDRFVVNKVTGEINVRDVSSKTNEHVPDRAAGGVRELPVPAERRSVPCLSDERIAELWKVARKIEKHYGRPQDIEWAVPRDGGRSATPVYLLQSRPETVWANRDQAPKAKPTEKPFDHLINLMSSGKNRK
jgi:pyruvate,water dikinase